MSPHSVGDIVDLPAEEARLLLAEEWAIDRERRQRHVVHDVAEDRRRRPSKRLPPDDEKPSHSQE